MVIEDERTPRHRRENLLPNNRLQRNVGQHLKLENEPWR